MNNRPKIIYIGGFGRSGSTLISKILGNIPEFFNVNELCFIWEHGIVNKDLCGCGLPVKECKTWNKILLNAFGKIPDKNQICHSIQNIPQNRHLLFFYMFSFIQKIFKKKFDYEEYKQNLSTLYQSIIKTTNTQVIIDSSKLPSYANIITELKNFDVYIIHLVKDSRATAYSWTKTIKREDSSENGYMEKYSPIQIARQWTGWNLTFQLLKKRVPYLQINYEDFTNSPQKVLKNLLSFINEEDNFNQLSFSGPKSVNLKPDHSVWGNPMKSQKGDIRISEKREWEKGLNLKSKLFITILTFPLLMKYYWGFNKS